jgi:hypothetical protein
MFKFFTKEVIKPFEVPDYIILNVDNFNLWFNSPKDSGIYAHPGIFLRLDKLSTGHMTDYIENCYGIESKSRFTESVIYEFHTRVRFDWIKKIDKKNNIPKGWFVYESGQSPLHLLWFVNLVNLEDLGNSVEKPRYSFVEEMDSFESALEEAIKGCK